MDNRGFGFFVMKISPTKVEEISTVDAISTTVGEIEEIDRHIGRVGFFFLA